MTPYWITTDLDGTLLDHHQYGYDAALPALQRCKDLGVPIILNTSKTQAETLALHQELDLETPIIVENGSALIWPDESNNHRVFGELREPLLEFIAAMRQRHGFCLQGFNDWSISEIMQHTGLSAAGAQLAAKKEYSEPFIWQDSGARFALFDQEANQRGFKILKGGRFFHLQGRCDKAKPLSWLRNHTSLFFQHTKTNNQLIALGDNHNDVAMLEAADIAVCVKNPHNDFPELNRTKKTLHTNTFGPEGWNQAVLELLSASTTQT